MRRAAALCLILCFPTLALADPIDLGGSWKVPSQSGGVIGTVRVKAGEEPGAYRLRFILGDGSVKELDGRFDGEVLTTSRPGGEGEAVAAAHHVGALGALEGASGGATAAPASTAAASAAATGAYRLRRTVATIDGERRPSYRFEAEGAANPEGLTPVAAFGRVALALRIVGPGGLKIGDRAHFAAEVRPGGVPGALSWSVSGAYAWFSRQGERLRLEAREAGTVRVFCRFTPEGGTQGAVYEATRFVEVAPPFESIAVTALAFRSDHGLLKDNDADWTDGGAPIPEPEWTPAKQHPISHTLGEKVRVRVTLTVTPEDAPPFAAMLRGDGPGDVDFRRSVRLRGGTQTVDLESVAPLPRAIRELDLSIRWRYTFRDTTEGPEIGETRTTAFLTLGRPTTPSRRPGVTVRRMRQAVKAIAGAGSRDPHAIAKHVIGKWSRFNLDVAYWNAWELGDDKVDPETGQLIGADCQTIVRYTENVIGMAGVPGQAEFVVVWAKVKRPEKALANPVHAGHMGNPRQLHNDHFSSRSERRGWVAYLIDGNNRPNNYEAALRFTHGGEKLYYPGGVRAVMSHADQVLRVFGSMSWVDTLDGFEVKDAIVRY